MKFSLEIHLKKDQILFCEGQESQDFYSLVSGELLAFNLKGTKISPVAIIKAGQYVGEMSYFDRLPRSCSIVALKPSVLGKIQIENLKSEMPEWLQTIAVKIVQKIRHSDDIIRERGLKKGQFKTLNALSIEDQRHYFELIENFKRL